MQKSYNLVNIGLSDYAIHTYLSLLQHHPVNGSQLSKQSGIPRARIYDILRTLKKHGFVAEASKGIFIPLPPDELIKQLRRNYEADLHRFETLAKEIQAPADHDFIWTISGYQQVMDKAREMIDGAREEIYIRLFPQETEIKIALGIGCRGAGLLEVSEQFDHSLSSLGIFDGLAGRHPP